jgi:hypothetical protein
VLAEVLAVALLIYWALLEPGAVSVLDEVFVLGIAPEVVAVG